MAALEGFTEVSAVMRSGVYVLAFRGEVVYVGQSKSMYSRIYTHRNLWNQSRRGKQHPSWLPNSVKGILFDEVWIKPCHVDQLDTLEREMITLHRPKHNHVHKPRERISTPVALMVNGIALTLNAHAKPPTIERRV